MAQFFQETIDEHRKTFDASHLRDLLDTYLYEIQKANEEGAGEHLFEGKDHGKSFLFKNCKNSIINIVVLFT